MHLDEERLQRLLHGELELSAERSARDHLASCAECRTQVDLVEREEAELSRLLRQLDRPVPALVANDVVSRARSGGVRAAAAWARRAAVVLVGLGLAGVAYAAPGSPIPAWIQAVIGRSERPADTPAPSRAESLRTGDPDISGIAVDPGPRLVIVFPSPPPGAQAEVSLSDTSDVVVRAVTGRASFSSGADRLVVASADSAVVFQIVLPRIAPLVAIQAGGSVVFRKQGVAITTAADPTSEGKYLLTLGPQER